MRSQTIQITNAFQMVADMTIEKPISVDAGNERLGRWLASLRQTGLRDRPGVAIGLLLVWALLASQPAGLRAQDFGPANDDRLKQSISVAWSDFPLRDALQSLSGNQQVPIFLDRRVDPSLPIQFHEEHQVVAEILFRIAEQTGCGVVWLGDVAYLCRAEEAANLMVLRDALLRDIQRLPTARKRVWLQSANLRFPRLTQPATLLDTELAGLPASDPLPGLPHDLWPEYDLGSMRAIDRLILILFGFQRWPVLSDGELVEIAEFPRQVPAGTLRWRLTPRVEGQVQLAEWQASFPQVQMRLENRFLVAEAAPQPLYALQRELARKAYADSQPQRPATGATEVVSGRIKGTIGQALQTAAQGLQVELQFDPTLRPILLQQIDLNVTRVTHEELVQRVLQGTGLKYSLNAEALQIER